MRKQKIQIIVFVLAVMIASVYFFSNNSKVDEKKLEPPSFVLDENKTTQSYGDDGTADIGTNDSNKTKVSICDLSADPNRYLNKKVEVIGIVKYAGKNYYSGQFFLEENNCKINVNAWRVLEEMLCPEGPCDRDETMLDYLNKKVNLSGTLKSFSDPGCKDKECEDATRYYRISDLEKGVKIIL